MPAGIFIEWERGFALARFGGNEPQLHGAHGSLIAVGNAEFPDYALYVDLDGSTAKHQLLRDLTVSVPLSHQSHDLDLSPRKPRSKMRWGLWALFRSFGGWASSWALLIMLATRLLRRLVEERRIQRRFPADHLPHSADHLLLGGILEHAAGGACLKCLEQVVRVLVYGFYYKRW